MTGLDSQECLLQIKGNDSSALFGTGEASPAEQSPVWGPTIQEKCEQIGKNPVESNKNA